MPEELEGQARGEEAGELGALERGCVLAGEEDRVAGGDVLANADRGAAAVEAAAGWVDDGWRAVDDAPAGGARTGAPIDLLQVGEEGLVGQPARVERSRT